MGKLQKLDLWKLGANYTLGGLTRSSSYQHGTSEHGWERQVRGCPQCRTVCPGEQNSQQVSAWVCEHLTPASYLYQGEQGQAPMCL